MKRLLVLGSLLLIGASTPIRAQDLQIAIDAIPPTGGTIQLEARQYWQHTPLNLRNRKAVRIVGEGIGTELAFVVAEGQPLLIDMTGASTCELSHLKVTARVNTPRIGMLLARNQSGASAGHHLFTNVRWEAPATLANVVSLGSEVNTYTHCQLMNTAPSGGNFITSRDNWLDVSSPFGDVHGGSNLCQYFVNCAWGVYARTGQETNITLQSGTGHFQIHGGTMSNKSLNRTVPDVGGLAGIRIGGPDDNRPCHQIVILGLEAETHGTRNAIQIVGRTRGLRIQNTLLQSLESAIRITGTLEDSVIEQNTLDAGMAQYDWCDGPKRALVTVSNATVRNCKFDLRWRYLGLLESDQSPRDAGRRPEIALSVIADGAGCEFWENEIILRSHSDMLVAPAVDARNNRVRAFRCD